MGSARSKQEKDTPIRIGRKLSKAFERIQEKIRERAYHISQRRAPHEGDALTDWLDAQMQILAPIDLLVKDQKKNIVVEANLKEFSPQEIEVEVGTNELKVFGSRTESTTDKKRDITQSSSASIHFYQTLPLPCEVDRKGCQATLLKNGKLKITLPKNTG